jgi:hypothetical protein
VFSPYGRRSGQNHLGVDRSEVVAKGLVMASSNVPITRGIVSVSNLKLPASYEGLPIAVNFSQ